jgi:hypothetical protein
MSWKPVGQAPADLDERPVVVGFGPCGMFAGLVLAQMGFKPIVLERGKTVRERTKDTWRLWRKRELTPESNVQYGEGGAGTFSDGKLYSQIKDPRHLGRKVLTEFVTYGAPPEILYAAHPHIGTFKLVKLVEGIREEIVRLGGEIRFEQRVTDVQIEEVDGQRQLVGLQVLDQATGQSYALPTHHAVMALGHSSRDTFAMFYERGVAMEAKPFSVGFRIEHPQSVIDRARWGKDAGHPLLGAADYKLVHHAKNGRAVYSFCMCPGGTVVAATSEPGRVVTNGMSQYSRAERNANAGMVCAISPEDYPQDAESFAWAFDGKTFGVEKLQKGEHHPLSGIVLQRQLESKPMCSAARTTARPASSWATLWLASHPPNWRSSALLQARHQPRRSAPGPARLCDRGHARGPARLRQEDSRLRHEGCRADRCGNPHLVPGQDRPRRRLPERQHARSVPGRRRCQLRGRHSVGRCGRHQGRRGRGCSDSRRGSPSSGARGSGGAL